MRDFAQARAVERTHGAFSPLLRDSAQAAFFDAWFRGQSARAVRTLDAAIAATPLRSLPAQISPYPQVAQIYAMAGRPDRARAMLAQMQADIRDTSILRIREPDRHSALGYIALAEKHPLDAVREFRMSDSLPDGPASECAKCVAVSLGMAFDQANLPDSAIAEFRRYLDTPYTFALSVDNDNLAFVYKSLGQLYEAKGNAGEAATYYSKFVELWKNADPDLQPQVADVKQRLTHLRDTEKHP
jgi:tetratricopeptide (TPR) repeat protein